MIDSEHMGEQATSDFRPGETVRVPCRNAEVMCTGQWGERVWLPGGEEGVFVGYVERRDMADPQRCSVYFPSRSRTLVLQASFLVLES